MSYSIRRAVAGDASPLTVLATRAKAHWGYPPEWIAAWQPQLTFQPKYFDQNQVLVAEDEHGLLGMCALEDHGEWWELEHLWVDPDCMGRGVGRILVERALALARVVRPSRVVIEADPHAAGFYRRLGAIEVGAVRAPMPGAPERVLPVFEFAAP